MEAKERGHSGGAVAPRELKMLLGSRSTIHTIMTPPKSKSRKKPLFRGGA